MIGQPRAWAFGILSILYEKPRRVDIDKYIRFVIKKKKKKWIEQQIS